LIARKTSKEVSKIKGKVEEPNPFVTEGYQLSSITEIIYMKCFQENLGKKTLNEIDSTVNEIPRR
jgi:hypothetical protein